MFAVHNFEAEIYSLARIGQGTGYLLLVINLSYIRAVDSCRMKFQGNLQILTNLLHRKMVGNSTVVLYKGTSRKCSTTITTDTTNRGTSTTMHANKKRSTHLHHLHHAECAAEQTGLGTASLRPYNKTFR